MPRLPRLLDANANRASEGLRVLEDLARFSLDRADLADRLRTLRHDLRTALARLPAGWLASHRDAACDVGRVHAPPGDRPGLHDVAAAAGRRTTEALRVLEEVAATLDPDLSRALAPLRYRAYDCAAALETALAGGGPAQWKVAVIVTGSACRLPWDEVVRGAVAGGADCIQVREKTMPDRALLDRVDSAIAIARPLGAAVIVNDRADVALAAGADGVHVGAEDLAVQAVRRIAGTALLVGATAHTVEEARRVARTGADYAGIGAMEVSRTKPGVEPGGPSLLRACLEAIGDLPHLAIGGITPSSMTALVAAGCQGVAVGQAVCGAEDPATVVAALREHLEVGVLA